MTTGVGVPGTDVRVLFSGDTFDSNINLPAGLDPTSIAAYSKGSGFGGSHQQPRRNPEREAARES